MMCPNEPNCGNFGSEDERSYKFITPKMDEVVYKRELDMYE